MKTVEERNEVPIILDYHQMRLNAPGAMVKAEVWGDDMPVVRLGSEIGFVDPHGRVYESVEAAFVAAHDQCKCLATASIGDALNKIALFSVLIAMKAPPSKIAEMMFHGEMFVLEMFSDMMEGRGLVEHGDGDLGEGYRPLELTREGEAGLRMCIHSPMVDLPFDKEAAQQAIFPELIAIELEPAAEPEAKPAVKVTQAQIDSMTNWALRIGVMKMERDGSLVMNRKYRTYSARELSRARARTTEKRIAGSKA